MKKVLGLQGTRGPTRPGAVSRALDRPVQGRKKRSVPDWLQRLYLVKAEFRSARWPATEEDGMRQVLALSGEGWATMIAGLKAERPGASARELEDMAHRLLWRWDKARSPLGSGRTAGKG